ncbi:MAG: hypothetical protein K1X55_04715 [Chitinophagales bacterium]|nr:hypothetical protein [Chitinophagales bacterium]
MKKTMLVSLLILSLLGNIYLFMHRYKEPKPIRPLSEITIHQGTKLDDVIKVIGMKPSHIVDDTWGDDDNDIFFLIFLDEKGTLEVYFDKNVLVTHSSYDNHFSD